MLTQTPDQATYNLNSEEVPFEQLPEIIQRSILCAEDFWRQYDAADHEERERLLAEHPYNNAD